METRREFIQKAAVLASGTGLAGMLPPVIQKALAIDPKTGSTYLDAEHVVILMQENRSFDHSYGTLQGVRGFNDPRAITLPNKNKVWLQPNSAGQTFAPFRLDLKDTKATWMSSLPHSWENQVDARNEGKYDKWLDVKQSGNKDFKKMPLTMGYYNREDIPFYYALADAFTVCDQNFCSSLTGTTPNRLYLWTGTIREEQNENAKANVKNEDVDYDRWAKWKTFPERLEENNVSWKIYQNELSIDTGFEGEEDSWLANFTDNPIEWFEQYHVKFSPEYRQYLQKVAKELPGMIEALKTKIAGLSAGGNEYNAAKKELAQKEAYLAIALNDLEEFKPENFEKLSEFHKNIHKKAFTNNRKDPDYHKLTTLEYEDNGVQRKLQVPKGDVLHQFREDVNTGKLPTVSWIVAPEKFSDHPGAPWFGAWYLSEVMEILTKNPEVWKKTVFILTYDENDGYFDHVPPFVPPNPHKPGTGKVSAGIDAGVEQVSLAQELKRKRANPERDSRASPIGLGFRVPMVIASPWSRGGNVCSEVFDHTSVLQFLEKFLKHKTGKEITETNISQWRRTVCGDLTSSFEPYNGEKIQLPAFVQKEPFIKTVYNAKFKKLPSNFKELNSDEIAQLNEGKDLGILPKQEPGIRKAMPIPYQLYAEGKLNADKKAFAIDLHASDEVFGKKTDGAPFIVYAPGKYAVRDASNRITGFESVRTWNYALKAGDKLADQWLLEDFENEQYHLIAYGPNGYMREFKGNAQDPEVQINCEYQRVKGSLKKLTGNVELKIRNNSAQTVTIEVVDQSYKRGNHSKTVAAGAGATIVLDLAKNHNWYDFSVKIKGNTSFEKRYAGHVENGKASFTDPAMGGVV
ncbi:phosphocholine-specific phospholipase C [Emticicia fluvialis]|uniref:phosphocholine-specific phospholipase C n=1 Tax=Emticicia fluvialis TaxID=2974474 RepID=UPI0021661360|nr:phospholipase C, phosphocholine-specific [Emticicia fluvialis]